MIVKNIKFVFHFEEMTDGGAKIFTQQWKDINELDEEFFTNCYETVANKDAVYCMFFQCEFYDGRNNFIHKIELPNVNRLLFRNAYKLVLGLLRRDEEMRKRGLRAKTCNACNGTGKKLVDWGNASYSEFCPACHGICWVYVHGGFKKYREIDDDWQPTEWE